MSSTPTSPSADVEEGDPQVEELEGRLRRALADLDNLRKRFDREVARERTSQRSSVASEWLPIVDNLELALKHANGDAAPLAKGIEAVYQQAQSVLERLGFPRFDDIGVMFDPRRHEAVSAVDSDEPAGTILASVRPGYGADEAVLRPAAVVVARPPDPGSGSGAG
jgi:molecular chaperone GrpE